MSNDNGEGAVATAQAENYARILSGKKRFDKTDRVLCAIGEGWSPGSVQALDEEDPDDPSRKFPYIVKLDAPIGKLIAVPEDDNNCCAPEVCFGQRGVEDDLWWTLFCIPHYQPKTRRFAVGDRVACAVEDVTDDYSRWAPGTVIQVDVSLEEDAKRLLPDHRKWDAASSCVPYWVKLDNGGLVFVHRDDHWLVRDLALQAEGPRQTAKGYRCLARMETRQRPDGTWEKVDHFTRQVRRISPPDCE